MAVASSGSDRTLVEGWEKKLKVSRPQKGPPLRLLLTACLYLSQLWWAGKLIPCSWLRLVAR